MAKFSVMGLEEYALKLSRLGTAAPSVAKMALYEGAAVVIEAIKENIRALPVVENRRFRGSDKYLGITATNKNDLLNSVGVSPMDRNNDGDWNVKVGFDGYGSPKTITKKHKKGLPNVLLARSIESGTSIRRKIPFVRPAINASKAKVNAVMGAVIEREQRKIME